MTIYKMNRNECVVLAGNRSLYSVFYQIIVQIWRSAQLNSEQLLMNGNKASTATAQNKKLKTNR